ncbi:DNA-directed RNA polymerase sigma-70 factor [Paractinoplanes abujensis]|uniref:RNA polymerase sigma-70 factor (ECF subfamily) n=1 Tax=Paractinoplanes abujensis TaxID=882441 RepID=A0A7W7FZI1_9ACTN|nr:sigma-70 family RNA polymerase sigma factor [Actinoplanes abujensis]MBB4690130.1 RNA polymerase sigma-70 factor (ECF subfamily) [Actinoplanes abujensis]GID20900.1 DNA-directed RNA polymerase sigma-70 factor [Actinoplanes abujensis]
MSDVATPIETQLETFRPELTGYCYRMLGSAFEAEDAVQDTLVRAWKSYETFEGRAALRSWLYRIATNVCLTMLGSAQRRARPMDLAPAGSGHATHPGEPRPDEIWVGPVPDGRVLAAVADPAQVVADRESIRLAFVAALQHLPPKQRAVLILREVLAWSAQEVADLLELSVPSVNSALQRARATIAATDKTTQVLEPGDEEQKKLLARYVQAFEAYDLTALTALLHEDATLSMPPLPLWLRGHDDITAWMSGTGAGCEGSRLLPVVANGLPAFAQYRVAVDGDGHTPWALIVLEISDGLIAGVNNFLDTEHLFPLFGLPDRLPA